MDWKLVLYGSTGYALAVRDQIKFAPVQARPDILAFIDDIEAGHMIDGVPVVDFDGWRSRFGDVPIVCTQGHPGTRRALVEKIEAAGGSFDTGIGRQLALDLGSVSPDFTAGPGCFVSWQIFIGPNVHIGRHVQVQAMTTLGHDIRIGDFTTICTSNIAGNVQIEDDVFVGLGSAIVNGTKERPIRIGRGAIVYAGSVVTKSVPAGARVAGNPARDIRLAAQRERARARLALD